MPLTMAVFAPPIASSDYPVGTNARGGDGGGPLSPPPPPPPPILLHHRPDEFAFADQVLAKTVEDSGLFPIGASRHDWFPPRLGRDEDEDEDGDDDGEGDEDDDDPSYRIFLAHVAPRCGGDDGTASTRTSLSSSSPLPSPPRRRRATIHVVGPPPPTQPRVTSGKPKRVPSAAMRISAPRAISAPPPSVQPCSAAITGLRMVRMAVAYSTRLRKCQVLG